AACPLVLGCPVAELVAPLREEAARGRDVPRPYVITPPRGGAYRPGDVLRLGVTLFGRAATLFPYLAMACQTLGEQGIRPRGSEAAGRRGAFAVETIAALHPLTGERRPLYTAGRSRIDVPALPVTAAEVQARAAALPTSRLTLEFLTPARLIEAGAPVTRLTL